MGTKRPDLASIRSQVTAADVEAMAADFDEPTADLMPSSAAGVAALVQARLRVSDPGDSFELEAESTADDFVRAEHSHSASHAHQASTGVSRSTNDEGLVASEQGLQTTDAAADSINAAKGGGMQMRPDVRARFESFFGSDLSGVRVHDDANSDQLCRSISAEAFTTGRDVFFARGGYSPGNAKGDHLLAHELTHVVQQGHAGAVSRRATPQVMRLDDPKRLTTLTEGNGSVGTAKTVAEGGGTAAGIAGSLASGFGNLDEVDGTMKVANGEVANALGVSGQVNATAATEADGSFGLFESVATMFNATYSLMSNWNAHSFDSAMNEGAKLVSSSLSAAQKSIQIAAAAGSTIGAAVIPGLGLAIAAVDLVKQVVKAVDLYKAKSAATNKLDVFTEKTANGETLTPAEQKLQAVLTRLRTDANWEMARTVTRIVGDIIIIGGQIGTLAGGVGAPAALAGGIIVGVAALAGKVQTWMEAGKVQDARAAQQADPDNFQLQIERLKVDSYYSACELIRHAATAYDTTTKKTDPAALALVSNFGIDEGWLGRYRDSGNNEKMLDMGAKIICEKLGKDPDPSTFSQDLMKAVNALKTGLKWLGTAAGYILKFAGRVLGVVAGQVVGMLGVAAGILMMPSLGERLIEYIEPVTFGVIGATDAAVDGVGDAWNSAAAKIDARSTGHENYFTTEDDVRLRAVNKFTPIIRSYFAEKQSNGTDVKPDSLTAKLKDEYTNLAKIAKNKAPKDKTGFDNESKAKSIIDSVIVDIIKAHRPDRVDLATVYVSGGKVTWKYTGDQKMKTKGFFTGVKNFFGGDKYEKV